jgi:glycosyltransferase involved in cell wall biosynthesis
MNSLLYVANARIPTEKAHGVQIMKMCEAFAQTGAEVELVVPFRVQTAQMRQVHDLWAYYGIRQRFKLTRLPSLDLLFFCHCLPAGLSYLPYYVQALTFYVCAVLYSLVRRGEVFYSREWMFFLLWLPWRWLRKHTLVLEEHTFPHRGGWGARLHLAVSQWVDRLVVITHRLKELYVAAGISAERVLVAPDGVDLARFENLPDNDEARQRVGLPLGKPVVGYVGRFHTLGMSKGLDTLVEAAVLLREQDAEIVLCFVGGPKESFSVFQRLAHQHGLPIDRLILVDRVPLLKVPLYMRAFDVCAMPFPRTEHYAYYMSPLKMFEYMASGTPIVATDLPSMREILRDGESAVLVEPDSSEALAQGIRRVLDDPALAGRIGEQARMDVWRYDWHRRAKSIIGLFAVEGL